MRKFSHRRLALLFVVVFILSFANANAQTYRILPLGNSITEGMDGGNPPESVRISYRKELFDQLNSRGYNFDFVGHDNTGYDLLSDADHGGIPGTRAQYIVRLLQDGYDERWDEQITPAGEPYLDVYPTDIILLHIGTNDITHGEGPGTTDMVNILDRIDAWENSSGTHVVVFVARIIRRTDNETDNLTTIQLNDNVTSMLAERGDPSIFIVNLETGAGINYDTELLADGIHPTQSAYDKMGQRWFTSLDSYLRAIPDSPTGLSTSDETTNTITLTWYDNSNNETGFEIERSFTSEGGSFELIQITGAGTTFYTDDSLNESSQYFYRVRAVNETGPSLFGPIEHATTLLNTPTDLQAFTVDKETIDLAWSDNSTHESGYIIERSEHSGTAFEKIHTTSENTTLYTDNRLTDGTTYFYRVRATNEVVTSPYSNEAIAATDLSAPSELSAIATNKSTIWLEWSDNSDTETGFMIERSKYSGTAFEEIHTTSENTTGYTDKGLTDGVEYFYQVRAIKGMASSTPSYETSAITNLAAPSGLYAISMANGTINLVWLDNSASETGFIVERSKSSGTGFAAIYTTPANETTYLDSGFEDENRLFYRVRTTNSLLYSKYSNEAQPLQNTVLSENLFTFYPNPSNGHFLMIINRGSVNARTGVVTLTDLSGRVQFQTGLELSGSAHLMVREIRLPDSLANGFYGLTLTMGSRSVSEVFLLIR